MSPRRRSFRSIAALAALLVSWTTGPGAAFCFAEPSEQHAGGAAMHGGHGSHAAHAGHHAPAPEREQRAPKRDAPSCPWMAMSGGSCLVAPAPSATLAAETALADAEYPHPQAVRDQLVAGGHFRPPKG